MKKIYLVTAEEYDYDQYDSVVVLANNKQEAIELCKGKDYETNKYSIAFDGYFVKNQGKITIKEIDLNANAQVILASFNAG